MNTFICELFVRLKGDRFWEVKGKVAIAIPVSLFVYIIPQQGFNVKDARVSFNSNGDRIYLTASSDRGTNIQGLLQAKAILESNR
ncbi:hypothetical protein [Microcoleus sp. PH2017_18_LLB_O_A]|uniref:hypothetical protein n=1 Tax=Microcoleus sp. PH2017_18_LLB_O_A TaxID=2798829 RepID=UPI001D752C22|nr:hypothetical protein [Microcoleus sp. PH2017_18_LLB_O_A]MCC3520070.1 hypothetical protein [Microcoleus sp. PH2017_18_LLB_O_A]